MKINQIFRSLLKDRLNTSVIIISLAIGLTCINLIILFINKELKTLAKEFASRNIQVNAVAPGFIDTDMTQKLTPQQREALMNMIPMKRIAKPEEIANVVVFLASPAASYITGQVLNVDGGLVM